MTNESVEKLVDQLQKHTEKTNASFGLFQYNGPSESYIRANKQGLILFAIELLKASNSLDERLENNAGKIIPVNYEHWIDDRSEMVMQYIQPTLVEQKHGQLLSDKKGLAYRRLPTGRILVGVVLLLSLIVGFWAVAKWIRAVVFV